MKHARNQPQFLGGKGIFSLGGKEQLNLGQGSCLRYYAYRKMIAVNMAFGIFFCGGTNNKFGGIVHCRPRACFEGETLSCDLESGCSSA